ncbi:hypothetical protein [Bacteroides fragilis]|uniref:hypothetical protein n=1 Tax=Bacteroides fragilis TaxID=817 RepID=UPI0011B74D17|nr:hypothetical protein [Bacteroides fragilis]
MSLLTLKSRGNFHATAPLSNSYTNCWIKEKGWLYLRMTKDENIGDERSRTAFLYPFSFEGFEYGGKYKAMQYLSQEIYIKIIAMQFIYIKSK